jgi:hypothetical protein
MTTISIQPFEAEYKTKMMNAAARWSPCQVVGVETESTTKRAGFVVLIEDDDGIFYVHDVEAVRKV